VKIVQFDTFGGPEVLTYRDVAAPEPESGDVLLDIHYIGVNHLDIDVREGASGLPVALPHTLGTEAAGIVAAVGPDTPAFSVGDRVATYAFRSCGSCPSCAAGRPNLCARIGTLGAHDPGTYAGQIALPVARVVKLPDGLSALDAIASYKLATAWEALVETAALQPGETMAVTGAGGSVGSAAVLLGKHLGATVIGIASSDARCAQIAEIGADHTINYRDRDLATALLDVTDGKGVDLVFDVAGGELLVAAIRGLAWGGRVALVGAHAGEVVPVDMVDLFRRHLTIYGCGRYTRPILEAVFAARADGLAAPPVDTIFPLAKAADAHRLMESRGFFGRILLTTQ
jgi:NADPH:quinone reductase-like Zn-dependent oxidoreductase